MASVYSYAIGATSTTTNLEELTVPVNPPRGQWFEASVYNDKLDAHVSGHGFPYAVWSFDILTQAMVEQLRSFVGSAHSAVVYIVTRIPPTATDPEAFVKYSGVMVWPTRDLASKRQPGGRYLGVEFTFRRLEEVP